MTVRLRLSGLRLPSPVSDSYLMLAIADQGETRCRASWICAVLGELLGNQILPLIPAYVALRTVVAWVCLTVGS